MRFLLPTSIAALVHVLLVGCAPPENSGDALGCSDGTLHVLSGSPAGADPAFAAVFGLYAERCPGVRLVEEIPLNQVTQADQFLDDMARGDPPDLFQFDAGRRALHITTADPGELYEPLDFLFEHEGWGDSYPAGIFDSLASYEGHIYLLPYISARQNNLVFNTALLADRGLTPPTT